MVRDARAKARRAGARFFFTWNINEFVLWETEPADASWQGQKYRSWEVTQVHREVHLDLPMTVHAVRVWLDDFLHEFARIVHGDAVIGHKSPDEKFIEALESSLRLPIQLTLEAVSERYRKPRFRPRSTAGCGRNKAGSSTTTRTASATTSNGPLSLPATTWSTSWSSTRRC